MVVVVVVVMVGVTHWAGARSLFSKDSRHHRDRDHFPYHFRIVELPSHSFVVDDDVLDHDVLPAAKVATTKTNI